MISYRSNQICRVLFYGFIAFLIAIFTKGIYTVDAEWERIGGGKQLFSTLLEFFPPDLGVVPFVYAAAIETVGIAILGTLLSICIGVPIALLAAHNVTPFFPFFYLIARVALILSRSIHEIVWALLFVASFGLGVVPGVLALAFRSFGFLAKMTADSIENLESNMIDAIRATGANRVQTIYYGVIPQILPIFISNVIFLFDINLRRSTIVGMVGAGGLGLLFYNEIFNFNYGGATVVIFAIILMVVISEIISFLLRRKTV